MQATTDLNDLRFVAAVAQAGTLAGAARKLGVNHATAFRRIEAIELRLGVRLFDRSAGRYQATIAGEELARAGAAIDQEAAAALRKVMGQDLRPEGLVRIATTESIAFTLMTPIVRICRQEFPEITLQIIAANEFHNLSRRDADIAIRPAPNPPDHLLGKLIGRVGYAVYAAPRYYTVRRRNSALSDLDWIALDDSLSQHRSLRWLARIKPLDGVQLRTNSYSGVAHACAAGLGLAVLPCFIGDPNPGLRRVTDLLEDCAAEMWLLRHPDLRQTVRIKVIYEILQRELIRAWPSLSGYAM